MNDKENLMKCESYRRGICLFGCDAIADNFYNSEEALDKNSFDYYLNNRMCKTLRRGKEKH